VRRLRAIGLAGAMAAIAGLLAGTGASAHSYFVGSEPSDGSALKTAPRTVVLTFSQAVLAPLSAVHLVDSQGRDHPVIVTFDPGNPSRIVVRLPSLSPDAYRLSFTVRDTVDLHATSGSIVLGIGTAASLATEPPAVTPPRPVEVAARWLGLTGFALLLGGLITALFTVPQWRAREAVTNAAAVQARLFTLAIIGVATLAAAEVALLVIEAADIGPVTSTLPVLVTGSGFGVRWTLSIVLLLILGPATWWLRLRSRRGEEMTVSTSAGWRAVATVPAAVCLLAGAEALVLAVSGHTGADAAPGATGVLLRALHLLGAGVWAGGLVALIVVIPGRRGPEPAGGTHISGTHIRGLLRAFSWQAAPAFTLLVATGLILSGAEVASVTALLSTPYGIVLAIKVVLVGAVAFLALRHHRLADRPAAPSLAAAQSRGGGRLLATLALETSAALVLLGFAATLGSTAPARGPQFDGAPARSAVSTQTVTVQDLVIRTSLSPNLPGRNLLSAEVLNTRRPVPAPIGSVKLELQRDIPGSPSTVVTTTKGEGSRYDGGAVELSAGDLQITVTVSRPGLPDARTRLAWLVPSPPIAQHPTVVSSAPIGPFVNAAAILVALVGLVLVARSQYRRRQAGT
jgi:copper transport protein